MLTALVFSLGISLQWSDAVVLCQENITTHWIPLGPPCPINCHNLRSVVYHLQIQDLLKNVSTSINALRTQTEIVLTPMPCATIGVAGCFCTKGQVEHEGLCLMPKECFMPNVALQYKDYLDRIVVY